MSEIAFENLKVYGTNTVSAFKYNQLVDVLRRLAVTGVQNGRFSRNAAGTTIICSPQGKGAAASTCPFDGTITAGDGDDDKIITFRPGTLNQFLPDNNFGQFHFDPSSFYYCKLTGSGDGNAITGCTISVETENVNEQVATANSLPLSVDVLIGVISGGAFFKVLPCGNVTLVGQQQFITDKDPPGAPGTLQYVPYYAWVVQ